MQAFIVRPFGKKPVTQKNKDTGKSEEGLFDFEKVQEVLISPALKEAKVAGGTTGEIFEPGDIRQDMFSLLLRADIVIADISIHNANVFYELGIRHALRDKKSILIKCSGYDITPFDILGYKYVDYDKEDPSKALPVLIQTIKDTIATNRTDSPVFNMLPELQSQDPERFVAVPSDFTDEVQEARAGVQAGKLALLVSEAAGFQWEMPALRILGEEQIKLNDFENARTTWEKIRSEKPNDEVANDRLATIYQRLAEQQTNTNHEYSQELFEKSDLAISRLLENTTNTDRNRQAEIYSLRARNAKVRWLNSWKDSTATDMGKKALQSRYLIDAYEDYERGYYQDLNHFYSGINALGLLTVITSLARSFPDSWELEFDTTEDAEAALKKYADRLPKLAAMVQESITAEKKRLQNQDKSNPWLNITEADLCFLTSSNPQRVAVVYSKVIDDSNDFNFNAAKRQLLIYKQLAVLPNNVDAAISSFANSKLFVTPLSPHYILFTGHMIDKSDRKDPRFPAGKEAAAKEAIKEAVQKEKDKITGPVIGIAGGACGGDILFHEVCEELSLPTELYLALPRDQFIRESVQFAGSDWVERFDRLYKKLPVKILSQSKTLPNWMEKKDGYSIWERNNLWMLYAAMACGGINMSLIALWDGKGGDAGGGTQHMVAQTQDRGGKSIIIPMSEL